MKRYPVARADVRSVDVGSELLLYDERTHQVHILNATAQSIWRLCDGHHEVEEIVGEISRLFPQVPFDQIRNDVGEAIQGMEEKQILAWLPADSV